MVGHRASLAGNLYQATFSPRPTFTVTPRDASQPAHDVTADVLFGADGIKSITRAAMLDELAADADPTTAATAAVAVKDTQQAAYRIMIHQDQVKHDAELRALLASNQVIRWIGHKRHIIAYPVSQHTLYNLSTTQPDSNFAAATNATYTTRGSKAAMREVFADFCPLVQRLLSYVPEGDVCEWKLRVHEPLPTWVLGSVALLGDACHPTLPHLAQGAAQAVEDGAVIAVVLARLPNTEPASVHRALKAYEQVRKTRAYALVEMAAASGRALHLGDGAAKAERDKQFAALRQGQGPVPDKWADADVQREIYGFDCIQEAEERFDEYFA
ncbi:hypothetical protein ARAM_006853 [Aspergillus rambellii]|uniref:FAD-binding domain-containing protein n=1 Tax=Aspergillus rambellii TaxID=308745 RepID=A0A0F8UHI9_9EURO|nr:hypothetical protein ARAM_006853 [Aspergillus rambellii]